MATVVKSLKLFYRLQPFCITGALHRISPDTKIQSEKVLLFVRIL